ncbi:unnamed protein product, partial [Staurois parvus]
KGGFQILISPPARRPPQPPTRVVGKRPLSPSTWGQGALGGSPPAPKHPPMLRACGLVWFRRGGRSLVPPPFPDLPGCMLR